MTGGAILGIARTRDRPARGVPRRAMVTEEPGPVSLAVEPTAPAAPDGDIGAPSDPVALFDGEQVTRLLDFLLDPAHEAEEHVEERGHARDELAKIVEEGGLPLVREALRRMQDPVRDQRRRAQLLLALAKDVPRELLEDLRGAADPLVYAYPELRAEAEGAPDTVGDGGALGDAPLLDVEADVRRRLWPDPEPDKDAEWFSEWTDNVRPRLLAWWREIPPGDRFLLADDELLVVARDIAKSWVHHDWRFVMLLRRREGRWRVAGFYRPDRTNELVRHVIVADFDGDGRKEGAVWTTIIGGWVNGRLVVVGSDRPDGVVSKIVDGGASEIRLVSPRRPGDPTFFCVSDVYLPSRSGHVSYLVGVIAREGDLLEWTGTGLRSAGSVWLPLR